MAKSVYSFRLEANLIKDIDDLVAPVGGLNRGRFVEGVLQAVLSAPAPLEALRVLEALGQRRVAVFSSPAPVAPNQGEDPANPVYVCLNPK